MAMCCKNNESFNPDLGKCVRDITCKIDCTSRQFYQAGSRPPYSSFRETQREVQRDLNVNVKVTETYECEYKMSYRVNFFIEYKGLPHIWPVGHKS